MLPQHEIANILLKVQSLPISSATHCNGKTDFPSQPANYEVENINKMMIFKGLHCIPKVMIATVVTL